MRVKQVRIGEAAATVSIEYEPHEIGTVTAALGDLLMIVSGQPPVSRQQMALPIDVPEPGPHIAMLEPCSLDSCERFGDDRALCRRSTCEYSTVNAAAGLGE